MGGFLKQVGEFTAAAADPRQTLQRGRDLQAQQRLAEFASQQGLIDPQSQQSFGGFDVGTQQNLLNVLGAQQRQDAQRQFEAAQRLQQQDFQAQQQQERLEAQAEQSAQRLQFQQEQLNFKRAQDQRQALEDARILKPRSPFAKKRDEAFATETSKFLSSGGRQQAQRQINDLQTSLKALGESDAITGRFIGVLPEAVRDFFLPESRKVRDNVERVVQTSLKTILGGQFSEKEAQQLFARTFNPKLDEADVAKNVENLMVQLQSALNNKLAAIDYANQNGTLEGFQGELATPESLGLREPKQMPEDEEAERRRLIEQIRSRRGR